MPAIAFVDVSAFVEQKRSHFVEAACAGVVQCAPPSCVYFGDGCFVLDEELHGVELAVTRSADERRPVVVAGRIHIHAFAQQCLQCSDVSSLGSFVQRSIGPLLSGRARSATNSRMTANKNGEL